MSFSFIHIADIHLGRPFSGLSSLSLDITEHSKNAIEVTFNNFIDFAINKKVDFVLIAGDTFDSDQQDFESKLILKKGLKRLSNENIKVYLICGNHDPLSSYSEKTFDFNNDENIKIIGLNSDIYSDFTVNNSENTPIAIIHALSFKDSEMRENPTKFFSKVKENEKSLFNIGLLHCDLDASKDSPYAPCTKNELEEFNYDYWALGHIHVPNKGNTNIKYSGTVQGRNTKETGAHGFNYISVDNKQIIKNEFITIDSIRFEDLDVDLSNAKDDLGTFEIIEEKINNILKEEVNSYCKAYLFRLNLTGFIDFYDQLNDSFCKTISEKLRENSSKSIYISQVKNNTIAKVCESELRADNGISGEIYKTVTDEKLFTESFEHIKTQFKKLLDYCKFSDEESSDFEADILKECKQKTLNLCNNIYTGESKED